MVVPVLVMIRPFAKELPFEITPVMEMLAVPASVSFVALSERASTIAKPRITSVFPAPLTVMALPVVLLRLTAPMVSVVPLPAKFRVRDELMLTGPVPRSKLLLAVLATVPKVGTCSPMSPHCCWFEITATDGVVECAAVQEQRSCTASESRGTVHVQCAARQRGVAGVSVRSTQGCRSVGDRESGSRPPDASCGLSPLKIVEVPLIATLVVAESVPVRFNVPADWLVVPL